MERSAHDMDRTLVCDSNAVSPHSDDDVLLRHTRARTPEFPRTDLAIDDRDHDLLSSVGLYDCSVLVLAVTYASLTTLGQYH